MDTSSKLHPGFELNDMCRIKHLGFSLFTKVGW